MGTATRELVIGRYTSWSTYTLYRPDGSEFMVIKEGEAFRIGNQMRLWYPIKRRSRKGSMIICQKFGDSGNVIEEFPLIHNKKGLWALTSGAARNGVFHNYHAPKDEIEKQLAEMGVSRRVLERVDTIDMEFEVGGQLCHHCNSSWGYICLTDGDYEDLTEPEYAGEDEYNIYHVGCMISTYRTRVYNATYAIYYKVDTAMNGCRYNYLQKVIVTPKADINKVLEGLRSI